LENFPGVTFSQTGSIPPDSNGAAGPNHFVEFVNGVFAVYNKAGTLAVPQITDTQFWSNAGITGGTLSPGVSDPRIIYDPPSQRWFAAQINTSSTGNQVLVARSNSSDPTGSWKAVHFTGNSGFADFPTLSADANGVYIGVNNFTSSTGTSTGKVSFFSIPKSDLTKSTPTIANITKFENLDASSVGFTLQGARDFGGSSGAILAIDNVFGIIDRNTVMGSGGPGATLSPTTTKIVGSTDGTPILARQPDGTRTIDAGDRRLSASVFQVGNLLYGANTISDNTNSSKATHDIVHWFVVNATTNTLVHQGTIGASGFDFFYPSIAANASGDFVIAFNRSGGMTSGSSGNISALAELCSTVSGVVTCGNTFLLQAGQVNDYHLAQDFGISTERWGDYSTTTTDPSDPFAFWTVQEIPLGRDEWGTQITEIGTVPEPSTLVLAGLGFLGLAANLRHKSKAS
jgi:hypothetical protein